jgi:hypothetical protein
MKNTTPQKCQEILLKIIEMGAEQYKKERDVYFKGGDPDAEPPDPCGKVIGFGGDWGQPGALTVYVNDTHFHLGGTFESVVDSLHKYLMKDE